VAPMRAWKIAGSLWLGTSGSPSTASRTLGLSLVGMTSRHQEARTAAGASSGQYGRWRSNASRS
jgi:hypothetical protein